MPHGYSPSRLFSLDLESRSSGKQKVKRYQILVLGLSCVCICLCIVVLTITCAVYFGDKSWQLPTLASPKDGSHIACIECDKLLHDVYDLYGRDPLLEKLTRVLEDDVKMCCADNSEQMSALMEISMRKQEERRVPLPEYNGSNFQFSPVTAHKRLYPPEIKRHLRKPLFENDSMVTCHFKKENDHLVEHSRGVDILDDKSGLVIRFSGLYYIYSSIHYRPDSAYKCRDFKYQTWVHYVERMSPNHPSETGVLLKTSHTCCDECSMDDETSYTGGVFYISAGDVIRVEIAAHGLIYFRKDTSFLGLMMLGSIVDDEKRLE